MSDAPAAPTGWGSGSVVVSVVAQGTFLLALGAACVIAWAKSDYTLLIALSGAASTNATAVINYWIGSSVGSARKTELLTSPAAPQGRAL